jgi:hypothetical protein
MMQIYIILIVVQQRKGECDQQFNLLCAELLTQKDKVKLDIHHSMEASR